jgi:eukaryotic-like serine/threonine-protein kinase
VSAPAPVFCRKCMHSSPAGTLVCPICRTQTSPPIEQPTLWLDPDDVPASNANAKAAVEIGEIVGERYEVLSLLGSGGMGTVYKAYDRELGRAVAIKVVRPEYASHPEMLQRFKQEIILTQQISHKNVIRIFDLGIAPGLLYISMEYIDGQDLAALMAKGRLPVEETVRIMREVFLALDAAHSEGIVHRDLKPQNILIGTQGKASVMDFGLARSLEQPNVTRAGVLVGTPYYMSPEQAKGESADARSDLFAAGIIFYELLTGVIPFHADTILASLLKRTHETPLEPSRVDQSVPPALSRLVTKCLANNPEQRYQSAADIIPDLDAAMQGSSLAPTEEIPPADVQVLRQKAAASTNRRRTILRAVAAVLLASFAGITYWTSRAPAVPKSTKLVTVLVADFANGTGESLFDGTLEPMFNFAVEGAGFVTTYNRAQARKLAGQLGYSTDKLDEASARLIAVREGLNVVVSGTLARAGSGYTLSAKAVDAVSGKTIKTADITANGKEAVLAMMPALAAPIRAGLGDATPASAQMAASETFTAGSLEAAHEYAVGQDRMQNGDFDGARQAFLQAIEKDAHFGRAYSAMAVASLNLGLRQDGEKYFKLAMSNLDRMTDRERYRTRGAYYIMTGDQQKCVDEYKSLVTRFPSDTAAHNNLALCYTQLRMMPQAIEEIRRATEISPRHAMFRNNLALFSAYAGEFPPAEENARAAQQLNASYAKSYVALAFAQLGQGQLMQAKATYEKLAQGGGRQASLAAAGLADLAIYEGRYTEAVQLLEKAAAADITAGDPDAAAAKYAMLAYVHTSRGQKKAAVTAATTALTHSKAPKIQFLAARILAADGEITKARAIAEQLALEVSLEPQAYAKLIEGKIEIAQGNARAAVKTIGEANRLLDTWIGRFDAGWAYLEAGSFAAADSEFDTCIRRRGEALALFVDESPTFGYFPAVYYSVGRVREALQSSGFADSYRTYLGIREKAGEDSLLAEVRGRIKK